MSDIVAVFAERYSRMSDGQLAQVAADENNLTPEALEALRAEIARRPPVEALPVATKDPLDGAGGWLFLYCFGCIVGSLWQFRSFPSMNASSAVSVAYSILLYGMIAWNVITGISVLGRTQHALRVVFIQLMIWAALLLFLIGVAVFLLITSSDVFAGTAGELIGTAIAGAVPWVIWFSYFKVSKRVKATFGHNL
jgi:hypothetical protein